MPVQRDLRYAHVTTAMLNIYVMDVMTGHTTGDLAQYSVAIFVHIH